MALDFIASETVLFARAIDRLAHILAFAVHFYVFVSLLSGRSPAMGKASLPAGGIG